MYSPPSIYNSQPEISIKIDKDIDADYLLIEGSDDSNAILYWSYGDGTLLDATRYAGGYLFNFSDRIGTTEIHGGNYSDVMIGGANTDLLYGGSGNDILRGGAGNDVLEGGAGADTLNGGSGIDTASYERASAGVSVDLLFGLNGGGDAAGDVFDSIENINGSAFDDNLRGDDGANTLRGKGGADNLYGEGGNDRLVVSDGVLDVVGGGGTDSVFVVGGGTLYADPARFVGIEKVYVREGTNLDMSDMYGGMQISSNSKIGAGVTIIGTHDADRILAGNGGDTLEGGEGGDKLFAGSGSDTFHFEASFGRDNVYGFDVNADHITVDIAGIDASDLKLTAFHGGQDTIVTFAGVEGANKIILHDVTVAEIQAGPSDLFTFGA